MRVKIKMKTSQFLEDGQVQIIEALYKGEKINKDGNIFVTYSDMDRNSNSKTTIKISSDEVVSIKFGDINSRMIFRESFGQNSIYKTPYGVFEMSIYTYKLKKKVADEKIKINIDYKMNIKGLVDANNRLEMSILTEE